jgi:hypothetical protein
MGLRGKIDGNGFLCLERPSKKTASNVEVWRAIYCPSSQAGVRCGDWCPHFAEPGFTGEWVSLRLCWGTVLGFQTKDFVDERSE